MDQMEQTLIEDDTVYASHDIIPNRNISLILQKNAKEKSAGTRVMMPLKTSNFGQSHSKSCKRD